jgi:hypothetical protein
MTLSTAGGADGQGRFAAIEAARARASRTAADRTPRTTGRAPRLAAAVAVAGAQLLDWGAAGLARLGARRAGPTLALQRATAVAGVDRARRRPWVSPAIGQKAGDRSPMRYTLAGGQRGIDRCGCQERGRLGARCRSRQRQPGDASRYGTTHLPPTQINVPRQSQVDVHDPTLSSIKQQ